MTCHRLALVLFCVVALVATRAVANEAAVKRATAAAQAWLALIDAGKYGVSYDAAAALFKNALTKQKWEQALTAVRKPLGAMTSRKVKTATYATSLPGAPAGEYVVIQLDTSFAKKRGAVETVTPMREKDGTWRVSGYFIK
jgi:hypothetical protein